MKRGIYILILLFVFKPSELLPQDSSEGAGHDLFFGFVRAGIYAQYNKEDDLIKIPTSYYELALKSDLTNSRNLRFYGDLRLRYGSEFNEEVFRPEIREAYIKYYTRRWELTAGQQIIKWGYSDFSSFTSKLNPQNLISRSPDSEDMDLGNTGLKLSVSPTDIFSIDAVLMPFYRGSVLLTDPFILPDYVELKSLDGIRTDKLRLSYGLRSVLRLRGIDTYISWFDGYDPMPGISLESFTLDFSGPVPAPGVKMAIKSYQTKTISAGFESVAGKVGIRGEISLNMPDKATERIEYMPLKEVNWAAGFDFASGNLRFYGEYSGKYVLDYFEPLADPVLGADLDMASLAALMSIPGFNPEAYIREQTYSFNRLYNNQLEKQYHNISGRIEGDFLYGKFAPSVTTRYNITTCDLYVLTSVVYKPADGIKIGLSWDYLGGRKNSLFDLADEYLKGVNISFRADF